MCDLTGHLMAHSLCRPPEPSSSWAPPWALTHKWRSCGLNQLHPIGIQHKNCESFFSTPGLKNKTVNVDFIFYLNQHTCICLYPKHYCLPCKSNVRNVNVCHVMFRLRLWNSVHRTLPVSLTLRAAFWVSPSLGSIVVQGHTSWFFLLNLPRET